MLLRLSVRNYALIDELELKFASGMNIITGETGAGKSILLGALGLIIGQRADSTSLLDKSKKCIVEGEFDIKKNSSMKEFLQENELDVDSQLLLRREINSEGKSRAFINDTPVNVQQLKKAGQLLIDVHSQHETLLLNQSSFQLSVIDAFAGITSELEEYKSEFQKWKVLKLSLEKLKEDHNKAKSDFDYFSFQFNELEEAALNVGEKDKIEEELNALIHAGEISSSVQSVLNSLRDSDENVSTSLSGVYQQIQSISKYNSSFSELLKRIKSVEVEVKDISEELENTSAHILPDPQREQIITDRLNLLNKLEQKHRTNSVEELIRIKDDLEEKINSISSLDEKISETEKREQQSYNELKKKAGKISEKRKAVVPSFESKMKKLLAEVSMPNAVLKADIKENEELNVHGHESVNFLFSANKGVPFADISKVASGGELSRLMLCLKSLVAKLIELPTIVFDEIDTGVSGETAFRIGKVMQQLSTAHQLIAITHLPQIASRGDVHFSVYKEIIGKMTFSRVKKLSGDERVVEIAKMLSGDKPTATAMENAKELLKI